MKEGVRFEGDILKEVAEDENLGKKEIQEIFKIHKAYVKKLMDDPEVTIISLHSLGNLYFNARYFNFLNYRAKDKEQYKEQKEKALKVIGEIEKDKSINRKTKYKYPQYSKTGLLKLSRAIKKFLNLEFKRKSIKSKNINLLEDFSLGLLKKKNEY